MCSVIPVVAAVVVGLLEYAVITMGLCSVILVSAAAVGAMTALCNGTPVFAAVALVLEAMAGGATTALCSAILVRVAVGSALETLR